MTVGNIWAWRHCSPASCVASELGRWVHTNTHAHASQSCHIQASLCLKLFIHHKSSKTKSAGNTLRSDFRRMHWIVQFFLFWDLQRFYDWPYRENRRIIFRTAIDERCHRWWRSIFSESVQVCGKNSRASQRHSCCSDQLQLALENSSLGISKDFPRSQHPSYASAIGAIRNLGKQIDTPQDALSRIKNQIHSIKICQYCNCNSTILGRTSGNTRLLSCEILSARRRSVSEP